MPIIEMHLMEGRTEQQKQAVALAMTEAITRTLGVKPEQVRILVTEHRPDGFYVGGQTMAQRAAAAALQAEAQA